MDLKGKKTILISGCLILSILCVVVVVVALILLDVIQIGSQEKILVGVTSSGGKMDMYLVEWGQELRNEEPFVEDVTLSGGGGIRVMDPEGIQMTSGRYYDFGVFYSDSILVSYVSDNETLVEKLDRNGGHPTRLFDTKRNYVGTILDEGEILTFVEYLEDGQGRCYISYDGKEAERVGKGDTCSFSQDGKTVFVTDRSSKGTSISALNTKNGDEVVLVEDDPDVIDYKNDPAGNAIAVLRREGTRVAIRILDRANGRVFAESDKLRNVLAYDFSSQGGKFFFIYENEDDALELSTLDEDGAYPVAAAYSLAAAFSREGDDLYFITGEPGDESILAVHNVSSRKNTTLLEEEGITFSVLHSPEWFLAVTQNDDGLTVYTSKIGAKELVEVYQEDDASLTRTYVVSGQEVIYLLTRNEDKQYSLVNIPNVNREGFVVVSEWPDIHLHNRSPEGDYLVISGKEDTSDDLTLYAVKVQEEAEIIELDDDADQFLHAIFRDGTQRVVYCVDSGSQSDDFEIREVEIKDKGANPETIYTRSYLIDVTWDLRYPFMNISMANFFTVR